MPTMNIQTQPISPTVVKFQKVSQYWNKTQRRWESESYQYIGRESTRHGLPKSVWANPYVIGQHGTRDEVIALYEQHITRLIEGVTVSSGHVFRLALYKLSGKILVCWCKPQPCHGDVLVKLFNEKYLT